MPQLEELEVMEGFVPYETIEPIFFRNIIKLSITSFDKQMTITLFEALSESKKLTDLTICYELKDTYEPLERFFQSNTSVQTMKFIKIKVHD